MPGENTEHPTTSYQIAVRFGDDILQAGFTAIPNLVLDHYAELGISAAEMMFTIHVWQYWWTEKNPYPSLQAIADKMQTSLRQVRRYVEGLKTKGWLEVRERRVAGIGQITNEYDFSLLIRAVVQVGTQADDGRTDLTALPRTEMTGGPRSNISGGPRKKMSGEEDEGEEDKEIKISSIRKEITKEIFNKPKTIRDGLEPMSLEANNGLEGIGETLKHPPGRPPGRPSKPPYDEDRQVILRYMEDFCQELSDTASLKASTTRAYNLYKRSGLSLDTFVSRLYEARAITKERTSSIRNRAGNDAFGLPVRAKAAFFFAVVEDLIGLRTEESNRTVGTE